MSFQPKILGILCNWCTYSAADAAGAAHISYAPNVRVVRVMCTGRVDPQFVLSSLVGGMDGVLICGCHPGDCHYINGNSKAAGRIHLLQKMLVDMGVEPERIRLEWISASETERYAEVIDEMTEQVRACGPLLWPSLDTETTATSGKSQEREGIKNNEQAETGNVLGRELRRV